MAGPKTRAPVEVFRASGVPPWVTPPSSLAMRWASLMLRVCTSLPARSPSPCMWRLRSWRSANRICPFRSRYRSWAWRAATLSTSTCASDPPWWRSSPHWSRSLCQVRHASRLAVHSCFVASESGTAPAFLGGAWPRVAKAALVMASVAALHSSSAWAIESGSGRGRLALSMAAALMLAWKASHAALDLRADTLMRGGRARAGARRAVLGRRRRRMHTTRLWSE